MEPQRRALSIERHFVNRLLGKRGFCQVLGRTFYRTNKRPEKNRVVMAMTRLLCLIVIMTTGHDEQRNKDDSRCRLLHTCSILGYSCCVVVFASHMHDWYKNCSQKSQTTIYKCLGVVLLELGANWSIGSPMHYKFIVFGQELSTGGIIVFLLVDVHEQQNQSTVYIIRLCPMSNKRMS